MEILERMEKNGADCKFYAKSKNEYNLSKYLISP